MKCSLRLSYIPITLVVNLNFRSFNVLHTIHTASPTSEAMQFTIKIFMVGDRKRWCMPLTDGALLSGWRERQRREKSPYIK